MWYKLRFFEPSGDAFLLELDESRLVRAWGVGAYGYGRYLDIEFIKNKIGTKAMSVATGSTEHAESTIRLMAAASGDPKHSESNPAEEKPPVEPVAQDPKPDTVHTSPNQSDRGVAITSIILHNTAGSYNSSVSWLCNPKSEVSAHICVGRTGQVAQIVPFSKRAWHAGSSRWNACAIGIEIEATDKLRGMTAAQELKVIEWCKFLMRKYNIKRDRIFAHRMVSNTDCPVLIWPTDELFKSWIEKNL